MRVDVTFQYALHHDYFFDPELAQRSVHFSNSLDSLNLFFLLILHYAFFTTRMRHKHYHDEWPRTFSLWRLMIDGLFEYYNGRLNPLRAPEGLDPALQKEAAPIMSVGWAKTRWMASLLGTCPRGAFYWWLGVLNLAWYPDWITRLESRLREPQHFQSAQSFNSLAMLLTNAIKLRRCRDSSDSTVVSWVVLKAVVSYDFEDKVK